AAVLAAFAGVALAADAVHGDGERLVRFRADRTERHRARRESLEQGFHGLDFIDRHWRGGALLFGQTTPGGHAFALIVHEFRVLAEDLLLAGARGVLELEDRVGVEEVVFAVAAPLVLATPQQFLGAAFAEREGARVVRQRFLRDLVDADAADPRG